MANDYELGETMKFRLMTRSIILLFCAALVLPMSDVLAQEAKKQKTRRVLSLSEPVSKKLAAVQKFVAPEEDDAEPDFRKALEAIKKINTSKFNKYELATTYNYYAFIYYSLDNVPEALKYYQLVVAQSPDISEGLELTTYKTIAQLFMMTEKYSEAISMYKKYMELSEIVGAEDYFILGQAYYQTNDMNSSRENIDLAVKMYEDSGRIPKENWYDLQRGLYYEKEDYKTVIQILEKTIVHYNKGKYWFQLGGMYGVVERSKDQLQAYNAAYLMGALTKGRDILNLAYLNFDADYPYKAATVIEAGLKDDVVERTSKNLETLGMALRMSQEIERSIPVIEEAANKSDDGNLYAQLAGTYFQADEYTKAIEAAEKAVKRKGLRQPGNVHITIGMSQFYLDRFDGAIASFREAAKNKGSEKTARQWIQHCESEKQRKAKLAEA